MNPTLHISVSLIQVESSWSELRMSLSCAIIQRHLCYDFLFMLNLFEQLRVLARQQIILNSNGNFFSKNAIMWSKFIAASMLCYFPPFAVIIDRQVLFSSGYFTLVVSVDGNPRYSSPALRFLPRLSLLAQFTSATKSRWRRNTHCLDQD